MTKYVVTGGTPLRGKVTLHGAKNAGFKAMIAALLANSPSTICDLGLTSEIDFAKQAITALGAKINPDFDPHCLVVDPSGLKSFTVPAEIGEKSRASNLYCPPLLAKFGKVVLPIPGGDKIGRRPLERHFTGLEAMGASVSRSGDQISVTATGGLKGISFRFSKNTHTGTEFLILAAVKAKGETVLEDAAAEPEIDDLIKFLNAMGAKIKRVEPRKIQIRGVSHLTGAKHEVMPDRNEAVTFACAALATRGQVRIYRADQAVLTAFLNKVREVGGKIDIDSNFIEFTWVKPLKATTVIAAPYPAFMTDWQPLWATLMSQAVGESVIHETIFESRFGYVSGLVKMGARIDPFQPLVADPDRFYNFNLADDQSGNKHAIKIFGPASLHGATLETGDIRSGATALLAGMIASDQTTVIDPGDQIKRGYEDLVTSLTSLGAKFRVE